MPLLRPLLLLIIGIIAYDQNWWVYIETTYLIISLVVTGIAVVITGSISQRSAGLNCIHLLSFVVFFCGLGYTAYALSDVRRDKDWAFSSLDTSGASLVVVKEKPRQTRMTVRLPVTILAASTVSAIKPVVGDALLYVYKDNRSVTYNLGDTLIVPSSWQIIRNAGNPYEFDYASYLQRRGIHHQQFLSQDRIAMRSKQSPAHTSALARTHGWMDRQLQRYVADTTTLSLLQAMILGDESGFDPQLREAYSQTGVVHIVSISGSHVAVLFALIAGMLFWVKGNRGNWLKYLFAVGAVWLYVIIAGAPASALRSAIMFSIMALAALADKDQQGPNTLIAAAFVLLLAQPAWLFATGFQLSFGAVLSMMIFYRPIYQLWFWPRQHLLSSWLWKAVAASLAAEVLTAPLVIYYFHNFPLFFLIGNVLAAVLIGVCALIGGMAILAFSWLPPVATSLAVTVTFLVQYFNRSIIFLQNAGMESLRHIQIDGLELWLIYLSLLSFSVLWLLRMRQALWLGLSALSILLILLGADRYHSLRQQRLIVYNNGSHPAVELISGAAYQTLAGSSDNYSQSTAHTAYGAWHQSSFGNSTTCLLSGKRILVLSDSGRQSFRHPYPVDVLVLARSLKMLRLADVIRVFSPTQIVLAQRPSPWHLQRWKDSCYAHGIALHNVSTEGAFMLE